MLKFFRKIRQQLITENNFSKYLLYALGEILLVVIGILLALQINNWNEQQKIKKEQQLALQNLHEEFEDNYAQFKYLQDVHRVFFASMKYVLDVLEDNRISEANRDSLFSHLVVCSFCSPFYSPSESILNSLTGAGKLDIISNDSLKLLLINWQGLVKDYNESEESANNYKFTYLYPMVTRMMRRPARDIPYRPGEIVSGEVDYQLLQSDQFYNILRQVEVYSKTILVDGDGLLSKGGRGKKVKTTIEYILKLLEAELSKQ